jgi:hypothetical protein
LHRSILPKGDGLDRHTIRGTAQFEEESLSSFPNLTRQAFAILETNVNET